MSNPLRALALKSDAKGPERGSGLFARFCVRSGVSRLATPLTWLLSVVLLLQLVGAGAFAQTVVGGDSLTDLSSLGAALGEAVPICLHGDPDNPAPAVPASCDHCVLCHVMATGNGPLPYQGFPARSGITIAQAVPPASPRRHTERPDGATSPRGPPALV
jgi:hypothetical protein